MIICEIYSRFHLFCPICLRAGSAVILKKFRQYVLNVTKNNTQSTCNELSEKACQFQNNPSKKCNNIIEN